MKEETKKQLAEYLSKEILFDAKRIEDLISKFFSKQQ